MKYTYLFLILILSACTLVQNTSIDTINSNSSFSIIQENSVFSNTSSLSVKSSVLSISSGLNAVGTLDVNHYLRMPQHLLSYFIIDIAIPIPTPFNSETDFTPSKGEVDLIVNKDVYLSFYEKSTMWYPDEEYRSWEFDQDKFIYHEGKLIEFKVLDRIDRNGLIIKKIAYDALHGTAIEYVLKHKDNYVYIYPSSLSNIAGVDKIINNIDLTSNLPPEKIVESQWKK